MSRIYFHTIDDGTAEVSGAERAYMGIRLSEVALAWLRKPMSGDALVERLGRFVPYQHIDGNFWNTFSTFWNVGWDDLNGLPVQTSSFDVSLNTAVITGSDPVRFMAWVHATCEIHGFVRGEHRAWLSNIIETGLTQGVLRSNMGWPDVIDLLRVTDNGPVVMSYSVTDSFPNSWESNWMDHLDGDVDDDRLREEHQDAFYDLPFERQWELGWEWLEDLNAKPGHARDASPETWGKRGYGPGWSVFDLDKWLDENPPIVSLDR